MNDGTTLLAHGAAALGRASWQGGVAILTATVLCRLAPRLSPRLRCWIWRLAYLKLFVALLWAVPLDLPLLPAPAPAAVGVPAIAAAPQAPTLKESNALAASPAPHRNAVAIPLLQIAVLGLWLVGGAGCLWRMGRDRKNMRHIRLQGRPAEEPALLQETEELCRRLGIKRCPELRLMPGEGGPVLVDIRRPAILLPEAFWNACTPGQRRLILAHELAHLSRRDLLWSWLPGLARCLFFFHPLVWYAEREWELSQELACDEQALRLTETSRSEYGDVLLKVALQPRALSSTGFGALCVAESYTSVRKRLLAMKQIRTMSRRHLLTAGALLGALGLVGIIPWRVSAAQGGAEYHVEPDARFSSAEALFSSDAAAPLLHLSDVQLKQIRVTQEQARSKVQQLLTEEQAKLLHQQTEMLNYDHLQMAALKRVGLTEAQQEGVRALRETNQVQWEALKSDRSLPAAERVMRALAITKATAEQIQSLLSPEQRAQWAEGMKGDRDRSEANPSGEGLTDAQKARVVALKSQLEKAVNDIKQDNALTNEEKEVRVKEIAEKFQQQVQQEELAPAQLDRQELAPMQWDRMNRAQRRQEVVGQSMDGGPLSLTALSYLGIANDAQVTQAQAIYQAASQQIAEMLTPEQRQTLQRVLVR